MAEELCEVVGVVNKDTKESETDKSSFLHVKITLDVTIPLCRGRIFSLERGEKGCKVSFRKRKSEIAVRILKVDFWRLIVI